MKKELANLLMPVASAVISAILTGLYLIPDEAAAYLGEAAAHPYDPDILPSKIPGYYNQSMYIGDAGAFYLSAAFMVAFLIVIAYEDIKTRRVKWTTTVSMLLVSIPVVIHSIQKLMETIWEPFIAIIMSAVIAADIVILLILGIYSLRSGRAGADRDIFFITALCHPIAALLCYVVSQMIFLLCIIYNKIFMKKDVEKFPFLVPYCILFGMGFILVIL